MIKLLVNTKDMSKEEWLKWRKKGIGGSDVSIICGMNKYKSALELWMEKKGYSEQTESGESAYWGNIMEPIIRKEFTKRTGMNVDTVNSMLQHPKYKFMLANVDGVIDGKYIFEAKTASAFKQDQWKDNNIPQEYMLQVQHYMAVTGYNKTYIAVLIGGNKFEYREIERDDELIDMIVKIEKKFWKCIEDDVPPQIDGSESCSKLMNILFPTSLEKSIELPNIVEELIKEYYDNKEQEKVFSEKKDKAINKIKSILGENEIGVINNTTITWKNVLSERLDSKKLKKEQPEIYNAYIKKINSRRFTIK